MDFLEELNWFNCCVLLECYLIVIFIEHFSLDWSYMRVLVGFCLNSLFSSFCSYKVCEDCHAASSDIVKVVDESSGKDV